MADGSKTGRVLVVDDDPDVLAASRLLLKRHLAVVRTLSRPEGIPEALASEPPDAILLDMNFGPAESSGAEGIHWLKAVAKSDPDVVIVLITAYGDIPTAVEAMKHGAADFVTKPWTNDRLLSAVTGAVALGRSRRAARQRRGSAPPGTPCAEPSIVYSSQAMADIMSLVDRAAPTEANVLVLGENGTGKELVARAIHRRSCRADEIFVAVDLGSVSESVFESELFGHRKGAFTDAKGDRQGRLETAHGGTLFLDEIGNLPLRLQPKLLSVLEQRAVTPVGANQGVPIDVRIVAATNLTPRQLADTSIFRQDLLFRLNTVEIRLPPLRERTQDIRTLVDHFLTLFHCKYARAPKSVPEQTYASLEAHPWPGNIRALRHAVERAVILSNSERYEPDDFSLPATAQAAAERTTGSRLTGDDLNLERMERAAVEAALERNKYNISHAARDLGITRAALYRRMEKYGL